jgi:hypothetical protein
MAGDFPPTLRPQRSRSVSQPLKERNSIISYDTRSGEKQPLDFTQRLERKLAAYNASDNILKRWLLELSSWILSALCMGAIVAIYFRVDGKLMGDHTLALNCANALGKISSAALIVPTSEALGQLKWNWFHNSKAIWDFEIFDKASRGPWGAALLLYRTKGRSLAALGALLIVLLLGIDTSFQQVVEYHDHWALEVMTGSIPRIVDYNPPFRSSYLKGHEMGFQQRDVYNALRHHFFFNDTELIAFGNSTRPNIPVACPTSKCEWPEYETLAVCSKCEDVSDSLNMTYTCLNTTIEWSAKWLGPINLPYSNSTVCGHFVNATTDRPVLLTGYVANGTDDPSTTGEELLVRLVPLTNFDTREPEYGTGSIRFCDIRQPIMDGLVASTPRGTTSISRQEAPIVNECMLSWCVQTVKSIYEWGAYKEDIVSTYFDIEKEGWPWPRTGHYMPLGFEEFYLHNITLEPPDLGKDRSNQTLFSAIYTLSNDTTLAIMNIFDDMFPSFYTAANSSAGPILRYSNYENESLTMEHFFNPWQAPNNQSRHFEKMAKAMTDALRSTVGGVMVPGEAYSMKSFIKISWAWLIFPFALLLLSLAFLISTIRKTSKDNAAGIWKTSAMPTLIYGLPEDTRGKFTTNSAWNGSHGDAKKVRIKLLPKQGWRVSGQSLLRSPLLPKRSQPPPGWI